MNVADLNGAALDYWVARSLHEFVREIYFTDSGTTVAIRGNDRGRPWDGRFTPTISWDAAAVVLERALRFEIREQTETSARCIAEFKGGPGVIETQGETLRVALLRAFVTSCFGAEVGEMLHQAQGLVGLGAKPVAEQSASQSFDDLPTPQGRIGDIKSAPR